MVNIIRNILTKFYLKSNGGQSAEKKVSSSYPARRTLFCISLLTLLVSIGISLVICGNAAAQTEKHGTLYMVVVDKLSISDLNDTDTPHIINTIREGSVGLASTRTLKGHNTLNSYLTIGSGNLGRTNRYGLMGFNYDELVPEEKKEALFLYQNLTGYEAGESACLLVNLPDLLNGISAESVNTVPGSLGQILKENGYKTCVLGNADTVNSFSRPAIAIGMDAEGKVALGDVGPSTRTAVNDNILSYETNYEYLQEQTLLNKNKANLMIIDLGDLARMEAIPPTFDSVMETERSYYLHKIDNFVGWIQGKMDIQKDVLLIVSPSASRAQTLLMNNFGPVIMYGNGVNPGYLTSAATHRQYIVANTDIAPTILNFFSLTDDKHVMIGQAFQSISSPGVNTLKQVQKIGIESSTTSRLRSPLIKGYVVLLIIVMLLASLFIVRFKKLSSYLRPLIVGMLSIPLILLLFGQVKISTDWIYILITIAVIILFNFIIYFAFKGNGFGAAIFLSFLMVLALDIDILTGTFLIQSSVLGYDPMSGARYYGIGNEYMGILIGASIITAAALYERYKNRWVLACVAIFFFLQCYLIGSPSLGANSDGLITAPFAYLITLFLFSELKISPLGILSIFGIILLAVFGVSFYDMNRPVELQSHIGRAANQIFAGGWQEALIIIVRKLQMNFKLIRYTIWSRVFLVVLLVTALFIYFPVGAVRSLYQNKPMMVKGFAGIVTAAITALLVNDSGIVAASTTSIYLVMPLLLMMLKYQEDKH